MMQVVTTIADMRAARRKAAGTVVMVPTMGKLHAGHARLIEDGRILAGAGGSLVVTIFVNPTQFGANEDLDAYPRDLEGDLDVCLRHEVDIVFAPGVHEMYHDDASVLIEESLLSTRLCGTSRPGHFRGVCTVVMKLLNLIAPHKAIFGKKDFQQLAIIRRLVRDLNVDVDVIGGDTVRETDGLAMSSRNLYLSKKEREIAPCLRRALVAANVAFLDGENDPEKLTKMIRSDIKKAKGPKVDYVEVVDSVTLQPVSMVDRPCVIAIAAHFKKARLIDNIELKFSKSP